MKWFRALLMFFVVLLVWKNTPGKKDTTWFMGMEPPDNARNWVRQFLSCETDAEPSVRNISFAEMMEALYNESFGDSRQRTTEKDMKTGTEANIGYFIQVSASNIGTLSRLMRVLYHKENLYAIHFDKKIDDKQVNDTLRELMQVTTRMSGDAGFSLPSNVITIPRKYVSYMGVSMVLNTIAGMEALAESTSWDFFINLSGSDYPLLPQDRIRKILGLAKQRYPRPNFMWMDDNSQKWRNRLSEVRIPIIVLFCIDYFSYISIRLFTKNLTFLILPMVSSCYKLFLQELNIPCQMFPGHHLRNVKRG